MKWKKRLVRAVKARVRPELWAILRDPLNRRAAKASRPSLTQLAKLHGTDKWGNHFYTPHYERHLRHLRDKPFTLLEIGIGGYRQDKQGGASLRMWRDFFPNAQIVGLDIEDKSFVDGGRIRSYCGSQTDPAVLQRIVDDSDVIRVIVDDGSHRPEHIRETFAYLFPKLADGGVYAIEDTHTSYWPNWGGSEVLSAPDSTMAMVKDLLDGLNYEEFLDRSYEPTYADVNIRAVHAYHNLVIIEKGRNQERTSPPRGRRVGTEEVPPVAEQRRPYSFHPPA